MKWLLSLLIITLSLHANEAQAIIKKLEKNLRGDYMYATMKMIVTSKRGQRTVKIESWSKGNDKSFIKILYPKKDKGITFLKIDTPNVAVHPQDRTHHQDTSFDDAAKLDGK